MNKIVILIVIIVLLIICFIVFKINEKSAYRAETNPTDLQLETFYETLLNSVSNNYINYMANQKFSGITTLINQKSLKSNSKCNYLRTTDGTYRLYLDKPTGPIRQAGVDTYYAGLNIWDYNTHNSSINITTLNKVSSTITYSELAVTYNNVTFKDSTGTPVFNFFNFSPTPYSINLELKLYNGTNVGSTTPVLYIQAASLTTTWNNRFGTKNLILWEPVDNRSLLVSGGDNNLSFNENSQLSGSNNLYKYDSKSTTVYISRNQILIDIPASTNVLYEATSLSTYTGEFSNYILRITGKGEVQFLSTFNTNFIDTLRSSSIPSGLNSPYFLEINNDNVLQLRDVLGNRGLLDDVPRSSLRNGQSLWAGGNRLYSSNRSYSFHIERGLTDPINIYMVVTRDPMESPKIVWKSKAIPMTTKTNRVRLIVDQSTNGGLALQELNSTNNVVIFIWIAYTKLDTDSLEIDNNGYIRIYNSSRVVQWPTQTLPQAYASDNIKSTIDLQVIFLSNTQKYTESRTKYWEDISGVWSDSNKAKAGVGNSFALARGKTLVYGFNSDQIGSGDVDDDITKLNNDNTINHWVNLQISYNGIWNTSTLLDGGQYRFVKIQNGNSTHLFETGHTDNLTAPFRYSIDISNPEYMIPICGYYNCMYFCEELVKSTTNTMQIVVFALHTSDESYWGKFLWNGYFTQTTFTYYYNYYGNLVQYENPKTNKSRADDYPNVASTQNVPNYGYGVTTVLNYKSRDYRNLNDSVRIYSLDLIDNFEPDTEKFKTIKAASYSEAVSIIEGNSVKGVTYNLNEYTNYPKINGFYSNLISSTYWFPRMVGRLIRMPLQGHGSPYEVDYQQLTASFKNDATHSFDKITGYYPRSYTKPADY